MMNNNINGKWIIDNNSNEKQENANKYLEMILK